MSRFHGKEWSSKKMILSNVEILNAIQNGYFDISPLIGKDPSRPPFNTSAVDLRLGSQLSVFNKSVPAAFDLRKGNLANFLHANSTK
jgi:hypothetical protein